MAIRVEKHGNIINLDTRAVISSRYHEITKAVNKEFRNIENDTKYSFYVGSYGRGTAIDTSDIDVLLELPKEEYERFDNLKGNGQSRLLQAIKKPIMGKYPRTDIKGNGQVVVIQFSDGMKIELLPAFYNYFYYTYPDSNMGGNWKTTFPKEEQKAMSEKNKSSNGLLFDTCKHIRKIRDKYFSSYHLSGIVIDTFVYDNIGYWHWLREGEESTKLEQTYEEMLLEKYYNTFHWIAEPIWKAPGSGASVDTTGSMECLEKVLNKMAKN